MSDGFLTENVPYENAGFFSRITIQWMYTVIINPRLFRVPSVLSAVPNAKRFLALWDKIFASHMEIHQYRTKDRKILLLTTKKKFSKNINNDLYHPEQNPGEVTLVSDDEATTSSPFTPEMMLPGVDSKIGNFNPNNEKFVSQDKKSSYPTFFFGWMKLICSFGGWILILTAVLTIVQNVLLIASLKTNGATLGFIRGQKLGKISWVQRIIIFITGDAYEYRAAAVLSALFVFILTLLEKAVLGQIQLMTHITAYSMRAAVMTGSFTRVVASNNASLPILDTSINLNDSDEMFCKSSLDEKLNFDHIKNETKSKSPINQSSHDSLRAETNLVKEKGIDDEQNGTSGCLNRLAVDANRLAALLIQGHLIWSCPLRIIFFLSILIIEGGMPAFYGALLVMFSIFMLFFIGLWMNSLRKKLSSLSDSRLSATEQIVAAFRAIKAHGLEREACEIIRESRKKEMVVLVRLNMLFSLVAATNHSLPTLAGALSICLAGSSLRSDTKTVFIILEGFRNLVAPMWQLTTIVNRLSSSVIAVTRLHNLFSTIKTSRSPSKFINHKLSNHLNQSDLDDNIANNFMIKFKAIKIDGDSHKVIDISLKTGETVAVIGPIGCGKSLLLARLAMGANFEYTSKSFQRQHGCNCLRVGYCPTPGWIRKGDLRDNIVYDRPFDPAWYIRVLQICNLDSEINFFFNNICPGVEKKGFDASFEGRSLGEGGVFVSGGQRQRIALARAIYGKPDLLLIDNTLSTLDSFTATRVFNAIISAPELQKTTRLFVTEEISFLKKLDRILYLTAPKPNFFKYPTVEVYETFEDFCLNFGHLSESKIQVTKDLNQNNQNDTTNKDDEKFSYDADHLINDEAKMSTKFKNLGTLEQFLCLVNLAGGWTSVLFLFLIVAGCDVFKIYLDKKIISKEMQYSSNLSLQNPIHKLLAFSIGYVVLMIASNAICVLICSKLSRRLHDKAIMRILYAPLNTIENIPRGRLLTRLGRDLEIIDSQLPERLISLMGSIIYLSISIFVLSFERLELLPSLVLPALAIFTLQGMSARCWRRLCHLTSSSLGPISALVSESLSVPSLTILRVTSDCHDRHRANCIVSARCNFSPKSKCTSTPDDTKHNSSCECKFSCISNNYKKTNTNFYGKKKDVSDDSNSDSLESSTDLLVKEEQYKLKNTLPRPSDNNNEDEDSVSLDYVEDLGNGPVSKLVERMVEKIDVFSTASFLGISSRRWVVIRCELVCTLYNFLLTLYMIFLNIPEQDFTFILRQILPASSRIDFMIKQLAEMDLCLIAIERISHYTDCLPNEFKTPVSQKISTNAPYVMKSIILSPNNSFESINIDSLNHGAKLNSTSLQAPMISDANEVVVEFRQVSLRESTESRARLENVSFKIHRGKHVAILGRTGAGKSTIISLMMGMHSQFSGKIFINGVDIRNIDLYRIRGGDLIGGILQHSHLLFTTPLLKPSISSVRSIIDPKMTYSDEHLYRILDLVGLSFTTTQMTDAVKLLKNKEHSSNNTLTLDTSVTITNLSEAHLQLMMLARSLADPPEILLLDEATSAIGSPQLDQALHKRILDYLSPSGEYLKFSPRKLPTTIISIVHRPVVAKIYQRILVVGWSQRGRIVEDGSPEEMLLDPTSYLYSCTYPSEHG